MNRGLNSTIMAQWQVLVTKKFNSLYVLRN